MRAFAAVVAKDLRLLLRDRAGLVFLALAPVVVITVAGLSLANLYGADPTGQTAYELPVVDEDGGPLAQHLVAALEAEPALRVQRVATRDEARVLVGERKRAGAALVIPSGTEAALREGRPAQLLLYTDAVKYLERLNIRLQLGRLIDAAGAEQAAAVEAEAQRREAGLDEQRAQLDQRLAKARGAIERFYAEARRARERATTEAAAETQRSLREVRESVARILREAQAAQLARLDAELRKPARAWLAQLTKSRAAFESWFAVLAQRAGTHADEIPPPPRLPDPPPALLRWLATDPAAETAKLPPLELDLPEHAATKLPELPAPPAIELPKLELPTPLRPPGVLRIEETDVSGGGAHINTFDQNVPGFSVTFLLLGMLLGVSLGLLDEQEWGTFERLQSLPIGLATVLGGKLAARFLVGLVQMALLFAVGRAAFSISLGPAPWALALPSIGIVACGVGIGLLVAAVAPSRESVLPVGSALIVTMAAVGGCWWPIDLEPRWMREVALAFPTTWAMDAFNDLMIRRRGPERALLPTGVLLAYASLYLGAGLALFRLRIRRAQR